jgi:hypothetical protein
LRKSNKSVTTDEKPHREGREGRQGKEKLYRGGRKGREGNNNQVEPQEREGNAK